TGNKDLLRNGSFEAPIVDGIVPGWTKTFGDAFFSEETIYVIDRKKALKITMLGDPFTLCQESSINEVGFGISSTDAINSMAVYNTTGISLFVCPSRKGSMVPIGSCKEVKPNT